MLEIKVFEQKIETITPKDHTRGTVGAQVKITFDDFWADYEKKVVFKRCYNSLSEPVPVLVSGMSVVIEIPPEILAESGKYKIGVVGIKDGVVLPTLYSEEFNSLYATDTKGLKPADKYTPSELEQLRLQKQDKLTAGVGISIVGNVISANSGTIKFKTVAELPETGEENVIYLLPAMNSQEQNLYDEYIYTNDAWEKIGSAAVEVDLTDYVKNTDYATDKNFGIVKASDTYGIGHNTAAGLYIRPANNNEINRKTDAYHPIVPTRLDYAVKVGVTTNTETLTDEEKAEAQSWLGITDLVGDIETALDRIIAIQEELIGGDGV